MPQDQFFAVNFEFSHTNVAQLIVTDVTPLCILQVVVEDCIAKEKAIGWSILGDIPITPANKEVHMDYFFL